MNVTKTTEYVNKNYFGEEASPNTGLVVISQSQQGGESYTKTEVDTWRNGVTQTQMGYLNTITSNVQTQLDNRAVISGTPANNYLGVWVNDTDIEGEENLTYDGTYLNVHDGKIIRIYDSGEQRHTTLSHLNDANFQILTTVGGIQLRPQNTLKAMISASSDVLIYDDVKLNFGNSSDAYIKYSSSADRLDIFDNGAGKGITILNTGDIGIHNTSPSYSLHMKGGEWVMQSTGGENRLYLQAGGDSDDAFLYMYDSDAVQKVQIHTDGNTYFKGGNVGINCTPSASYSLDVDGDVRFRDDLNVTVNIYGSGDVQHPNFSSGFQGDKWQVDSDGNAELESLMIRGALTVTELILNRLRYQDGGLIIGAGGGKISTVNDATQGAEILTFEDPEGNGIIPFAEGMIVLVQDFDLDRTTVVKKLVREVDTVNSDGTIEFTSTSGWNPGPADVGSFAAGDEVVAIGDTSGTYDSNLYMTAVDTGNPFLRIMDGVDSYYKWDLTNKTAIKVQIGNLSNLASHDILPASPGYGLYSNNVYLEGKIVATSGEIGGWVITSTTIESEAGTVGMSSEEGSSGADDIRIWAGHATPSSAPFYVTESGDILAESGTVGGWTLDDDAIYTGTKKVTDGYSSSGITLDSNGALHAENFYINADGTTRLRNVEISTQTAYNVILTISGRDIYDAGDQDSTQVRINYVGYNGGTTRFKDTSIGNGKGSHMLYFDSSGDKAEFYSKLNAGDNLYHTGRNTQIESTTITIDADDYDVFVWTGGVQTLSWISTNVQDGKLMTIVNAGSGTITIPASPANISLSTNRAIQCVFYSSTWYRVVG